MNDPKSSPCESDQRLKSAAARPPAHLLQHQWWEQALPLLPGQERSAVGSAQAHRLQSHPLKIKKQGTKLRLPIKMGLGWFVFF